MPKVDAELLVKTIAVRIDRESTFLSPAPKDYIVDPRGVLKLVEDAGVSPEQIDKWIEEAQSA